MAYPVHLLLLLACGPARDARPLASAARPPRDGRGRGPGASPRRLARGGGRVGRRLRPLRLHARVRSSTRSSSRRPGPRSPSSVSWRSSRRPSRRRVAGPRPSCWPCRPPLSARKRCSPTALFALVLVPRWPGRRAALATGGASCSAAALAAPALFGAAAMLGGTARGRGFAPEVGLSYSTPLAGAARGGAAPLLRRSPHVQRRGLLGTALLPERLAVLPEPLPRPRGAAARRSAPGGAGRRGSGDSPSWAC